MIHTNRNLSGVGNSTNKIRFLSNQEILPGFYYLDHLNRIVGPIKENPDPETRLLKPFFASVIDAAPRSYTQYGRFYETEDASHADLICGPYTYDIIPKRTVIKAGHFKVSLGIRKGAD